MAITYTWAVCRLDCAPTVGGMTDYVVTAHWVCSGNDREGHQGAFHNATEFAVNPNKPDFKSFDQLSEAEVIGWIKGSLGTAGLSVVEASIAAQIEAQVNPPSRELPLPWVPPVVEEEIDPADLSA